MYSIILHTLELSSTLVSLKVRLIKVPQVYTGSWDSSHLAGWARLHAGLKQLEEEGEHIKDFDCWWTELEAKLASENRTWEDLGNEDFAHNISSLLFSPLGARFKPDFKFEKPLECGSPAPPILSTRCKENKSLKSYLSFPPGAG